MIDTEDNWPLPKYNVGQRSHLHALGVISLTCAQFERSMDSLYIFHPQSRGLPDDLTNLYYFSLSEDKRLAAIKSVFKSYEKDQAVIEAIDNLLEFFKWCRDTRNQLLHSEQYPVGIGADPDLLYVSKRLDRWSPESGFLALSLPSLRSIADSIRTGIVQSATLHIHLRVRDQPLESVHESLRPYAREPLPEKLVIPSAIKLQTFPRS